jgi:tRNA A37 threonylcarbamoyladenosine synthetase subunit TsaC/SUA5/YrdC
LEILKISEKKLEILSLLSNAKMIFTQEIEKIAIEITKYFGLNSIYALHSFLIALKLETDEKKAYQELLLQMNGEIFKLQKKNDILKYKINGKPLLQAIYWLFSASKENVLKHLVLNSKIFISETDTIPGIFCRLRDELSAIKIYDTKRREASKPLAIYSVNPMHYLASNPIITLLLESLPDISMTIVAKANGNTPAFVVKNKFVGVRILSTQSKFYQFLRENNLTLLGTSANFSNQQSPSSLDDLEKDFIQNIPILKLNEKASTLHSSVLKIENEKIVILREGAYFESILNWIKQHNSQQVQAFEDGIEKKAYIINLNNNLQNNEK